MKRIWSAALCACMLLTGCSGTQASNEPVPVEETEIKLRPMGPVTDPTHADLVQNARDLCAAVQDSRDRMLEEAQAKGDAEVQIAQKACEEHDARLQELAGLDYDALSDEEIYPYIEEISDLITAFREARDAIAGLS